MVGITIYDVKDHHISTNDVREEEELGDCYETRQSMELRRAIHRWLEIYGSPRRVGRQQNTARVQRHTYLQPCF